ncbi:TetR/AcrR family transcriptional regulator [Dactylosporangium fulvum]|uniref:TetR/AcrR family transcriptional regulator n=1 Tax=Dactylosporangium fulvum TaxID=53359 RepID=A0ABY5VU53_9ACTN|nr:TetR/AcrR family transcriptional regulator [Dactylosporangium fulvum]UWP80646.1 TetR/AcrR family transcriptional regulator [Dactylosporangium fulvum]
MKADQSGAATTGGRTRNRRGEGALLRDEIVAAAERILEREGNEDALTLRSVAREAGISAPSIYTHFADRDAILDAVLDIAFERLRRHALDAVTDRSDPVAALLDGCRAYVDFAVTEPARYTVLFDRRRANRPVVSSSAELADLPPEWRRRTESFMVLVNALESCVKAGRSASTDPFADATKLWTSLHGAVVMRQFVPGFPWPPLDESIDSIVLRLALISE